MTAIGCKRCGQQITVTTTPASNEIIVHVQDHACERVLVAECWEDGDVIAVWTSDHPGSTGPEHLVLNHAADADAGWAPPEGDGWTYRWSADFDVEPTFRRPQ